jgi:hypothetical protein
MDMGREMGWIGGGGMTDILYEGKIDMGRSVNIIYM